MVMRVENQASVITHLAIISKEKSPLDVRAMF